ncbi:MAG: DEAD/DEAH box helicase [Desulfurellales bacterium]|nr:MAG: DEAD/DEAH box helicase [Desulfurellales bacterium]
MTAKSTTRQSLRSLASREKWSPHDYQRKAVKWLLEHGVAALFLDPGLGKTSITLAAFSFLKKKGVASKALVIAPLRVAHQVWPAEVARWADFAHLKIVVLHGPKKEELLKEDADVFVVNPEGLEWLVYGSNSKTFNARRWRSFGFDTLVIDELTKFKHPKGVRFKALKHTLGSFTRRWGLTGTPAANGLLDLFGQCFVLDLGNALGQYITHYRMRYFINPDAQGWKWVPQPGAQAKIYDQIKPLALRMSAEDHLKLPDLEDIIVKLDLPPAARKTYDALEDELLAKIGDSTKVVASAAAAANALWQICNGGLYVDDDVMSMLRGRKRETLVIHDLKTDYLEEVVNELNGQPLLVAYQFKHDLERLVARFGKRLHYFTDNAKHNKELEDAWNANELELLAGQQDAIGHGLNLQLGSAAHLFQYSNTWNFETWDQIIRRIRRQGTKATKIRRYVPVMRDTTDEDRMFSMKHKHKGQSALFEALLVRRGRK